MTWYKSYVNDEIIIEFGITPTSALVILDITLSLIQ